jgi:hypothetical protein
MHGHFDLGGLWEHLERRDRFDREFVVELFQIARQRRRIAGELMRVAGARSTTALRIPAVKPNPPEQWETKATNLTNLYNIDFG